VTGKKTGGRVAGTPNRITKELRETLKAVIARELDRVAETLEILPAKERLEIVIRLMPYCLPRVQPVDSKYDYGSFVDWD
jgi:hypothetical protein